MNILNKKNRIMNKILSLIYDIGGVFNKIIFLYIFLKMLVCVDKNILLFFLCILEVKKDILK